MKSKQELLASFMKSNKARREIIAKKAGYPSAEAYKAYLSDKTEPGTKVGKETVHIVNILDASSSMIGGKFNGALKGINQEISKLKEDNNVNYVYTLIKFSSNDLIKTFYDKAPLEQVSEVSTSAWGNTALYQVIGETLTKLKIKSGEERVLVSIFTDGEENNSKGEFRDPKTVQNLIKECEALGFTITFIGTDRDIKDIIKNLSIDSSNTLSHSNTAESISKSFGTKITATMTYSSNVSRGATKGELLTGFYSKQTGKL